MKTGTLHSEQVAPVRRAIRRINALRLSSERSSILAVIPVPIPTVHPVWLNVDSVFGRNASCGGWCRRRLLRNDDLLIVESIAIKESIPIKSKAVNTV